MTTLLKCWKSIGPWLTEMVNLLGVIVFTLGSSGLLSYWLGRRGLSFVFEQGSPMAVETAFGFTLTGVAFLLSGVALHHLSKRVARLEIGSPNHE